MAICAIALSEIVSGIQGNLLDRPANARVLNKAIKTSKLLNKHTCNVVDTGWIIEGNLESDNS